MALLAKREVIDDCFGIVSTRTPGNNLRNNSKLKLHIKDFAETSVEIGGELGIFSGWVSH